MSDNDLQKTSKIAFFSTKNIFVQKDGLNLGPKFEYSFTNGCSDEFAIANDARGIRQGAVIKEDAVGQLTMMMPNRKEQCLKEYEWL